MQLVLFIAQFWLNMVWFHMLFNVLDGSSVPTSHQTGPAIPEEIHTLE